MKTSPNTITNPLANLSESPPALGAILKILSGLISTVTAAFSLSPGTVQLVLLSALNQRQIRCLNLQCLASGYALSCLCVQLIDGLTAAHLHIIPAPPFKKRDKEKTETHVSHEHLITSISTALAADHQLVKLQLLLPLGNSANKKHPLPLFHYSLSPCHKDDRPSLGSKSLPWASASHEAHKSPGPDGSRHAKW